MIGQRLLEKHQVKMLALDEKKKLEMEAMELRNAEKHLRVVSVER